MSDIPAIIMRFILIVLWGIIVVFGCATSKDLRIALISLYLCYATEQVLRMFEC